MIEKLKQKLFRKRFKHLDGYNSLAKQYRQLEFVSVHNKTKELQPPTTLFNKDKMELHWVVPDFPIRGGGGHINIFRTIHFLEKFGHKCHIWIWGNKTEHKTLEKTKKVLNDNYIPMDANLSFTEGNEHLISGDAVIATSWETAYIVRSVTKVRHRFYFVQDFEPFFYEMGAKYLLAENTYRFDYTCITGGQWLKEKMQSYGNKASHWNFAYEPKIYFPQDAVYRKKKHIAFYSRIHTARRCVELGLMALERLSKKHKDIVVEFFGLDIGELEVPYTYVNHGIISENELAKLYNRCEIGMVFSATNYSIIPNEMMACGLPVLDLDGENTRSIFPEGTIALAEPTPDSISNLLVSLIEDHSKRELQMNSAFEYVSRLSWLQGAKDVETSITKELI